MSTSRPTEKWGNVITAVAIIIAMCLGIFLIGALHYNYCGCFTNNDIQTPTVGTVCQSTGGNYSIHVERVDPDPTRISYVNYILLDERGAAVPGVQGNLHDILDLDFDHETTNITFLDNDLDGNLSAGDLFLIKHAEDGGQARDGYFLLLRFGPTEDKMNGGGTRLELNDTFQNY